MQISDQKPFGGWSVEGPQLPCFISTVFADLDLATEAFEGGPELVPCHGRHRLPCVWCRQLDGDGCSAFPK